MDILQAKIEQLPLSQLVPNEGQMESIGVHANPRQINEVDYAKLVESMRADNLTGVMPLKVFGFAGEWIVLGGNMRLRALQELGAETAPCIVVPADTDAATLNKIIITDNSTFGDWDMDALANWDEPLADWGVDLPKFGEDLSHLLDEANFESLNDVAREQTGLRQVTFLFSKEDAEKIEEYCKVNSKKFLAEKIVDICLQQEAK